MKPQQPSPEEIKSGLAKGILFFAVSTIGFLAADHYGWTEGSSRQVHVWIEGHILGPALFGLLIFIRMVYGRKLAKDAERAYRAKGNH